MERRPALHLYRGSRVVSQNEDGIVVRGVVAPPALPLPVSPRATLRSEHVAAHDVCAEAWLPAGRQGVVRSRTPARLAVDPVKSTGRMNHSRSRPPACPKGASRACPIPVREAVERDREAMDSNL